MVNRELEQNYFECKKKEFDGRKRLDEIWNNQKLQDFNVIEKELKMTIKSELDKAFRNFQK